MHTITLNPDVTPSHESATLAINLKARALRQQGENIIHFGFGESPFPVPLAIQAALKLHADKHSYKPGQGLPELRDAVSEYFQHEFNYDVEAEQIFIGSGSTEFYSIYCLL